MHYTLQDELTHISLQQLLRVYFITSSHNEVSFSKTRRQRKQIKTKERIEEKKGNRVRWKEGEGREEEEKGKRIKQADWGKDGKEEKKLNEWSRQ